MTINEIQVFVAHNAAVLMSGLVLVCAVGSAVGTIRTVFGRRW